MKASADDFLTLATREYQQRVPALSRDEAHACAVALMNSLPFSVSKAQAIERVREFVLEDIESWGDDSEGGSTG